MRDGTRTRRRELVYDALRVVETDPAYQFELDEVAQRIGASRRSLQRAFETDGLTFRRVLSVARIRRAKALLEEGRLPIYAICEEVGYASTAEFAKAFKRHVGMLPSQYRAMFRS